MTQDRFRIPGPKCTGTSAESSPPHFPAGSCTWPDSGLARLPPCIPRSSLTNRNPSIASCPTMESPPVPEAGGPKSVSPDGSFRSSAVQKFQPTLCCDCRLSEPVKKLQQAFYNHCNLPSSKGTKIRPLNPNLHSSSLPQNGLKKLLPGSTLANGPPIGLSGRPEAHLCCCRWPGPGHRRCRSCCCPGQAADPRCQDHRLRWLEGGGLWCVSHSSSCSSRPSFG